MGRKVGESGLLVARPLPLVALQCSVQDQLSASGNVQRQDLPRGITPLLCHVVFLQVHAECGTSRDQGKRSDFFASLSALNTDSRPIGLLVSKLKNQWSVLYILVP